MSKDRNRRKDDLLAAARGRLEQGEESQSARRRPAAEEPAGREIMYRGQVMRKVQLVRQEAALADRSQLAAEATTISGPPCRKLSSCTARA